VRVREKHCSRGHVAEREKSVQKRERERERENENKIINRSL